MEKTWLPSLRVKTPEEGFALAVRMSLENLKAIQPSDEIRERLRIIYEDDAETLIAASQIIAINFQTIAAANKYWPNG
ncbi:peroxidase [Mesorhizobium sp. CU2]|uniref:hexameric tyrosine-coordinated heme protein n=1 Tax=unclassified Mesorhizobium TaxID=325217 RepID=UPI00112CDC1A|nr:MULTISPECIES: hexameric tyrosine-coordinated heme protein [unclassified Mesorhizobium]TPN83248.1 peroxidase [Mesorhizobium sp. CU3]TPO15876.1 peroxidase [Mesorhizobium sp. CU2]